MKRLWWTVLLLGAGCAAPQETERDKQRAEQLKLGEVSHLAFTNDGNSLVVVNEFRYLNAARVRVHARLRRLATPDWKVAADTGELSLCDLVFAPCAGPVWLLGAQDFDRIGKGNPLEGPVFYRLDPVTLERKPVDLIQQGQGNDGYVPAALACTGAKPLCAVHLKSYGGGRKSPYAAFLFDLQAGKKTVELEHFPKGERIEESFHQTVLAITPDGKHVVSCQPCPPFQLQLHDADTGKLVQALKLDSPVGAMKFSPDGKMLAALCWDGQVLILAPDLSKRVHTLRVEKHHESFGPMSDSGVAFVGDGHVAVVSGSVKVVLFETKNWQAVHTLGEQETQVIHGETILPRLNGVAGSPDGKLVAAGYGNTARFPGKVRVFEVKTGKAVAEFD